MHLSSLLGRLPRNLPFSRLGTRFCCIVRVREYFSVLSSESYLDFVTKASEEVKLDASYEEKKAWILQFCSSHFEQDDCQLLQLSLSTRYTNTIPIQTTENTFQRSKCSKISHLPSSLSALPPKHSF